MQQSSLNKHRPLPGIKSPTEEHDKQALSENTIPADVDGSRNVATDVIAASENNAATATESSIKPHKSTGPTTIAYKLKDLPLEEVIGEVETRINRLKTFDEFSNSECSDDLRYLNAATRCGSNPEVLNYQHVILPPD